MSLRFALITCVVSLWFPVTVHSGAVSSPNQTAPPAGITITNEWRTPFRADARVKNDSDVTLEDIAAHNLILFGDPTSNRIARQPPLRWNEKRVQIGKNAFPTAQCVPVFIYPNPLHRGQQRIHVLERRLGQQRAADAQAARLCLYGHDRRSHRPTGRQDSVCWFHRRALGGVEAMKMQQPGQRSLSAAPPVPIMEAWPDVKLVTGWRASWDCCSSIGSGQLHRAAVRISISPMSRRICPT